MRSIWTNWSKSANNRRKSKRPVNNPAIRWTVWKRKLKNCNNKMLRPSSNRRFVPLAIILLGSSAKNSYFFSRKKTLNCNRCTRNALSSNQNWNRRINQTVPSSRDYSKAKKIWNMYERTIKRPRRQRKNCRRRCNKNVNSTKIDWKPNGRNTTIWLPPIRNKCCWSTIWNARMPCWSNRSWYKSLNMISCAVWTGPSGIPRRNNHKWNSRAFFFS